MSPACRLSAARAVELALAEYGWEVTLVPTGIRSSLAIDPDAAIPSLRGYRDPRVTAAAALWTSRLAACEMRRVVLPSVPRAVPELDGSPLDLAEGLRPYVAAQVLSRVQQGAPPGDWLFVGERGQLSIRSIESIVVTWLQAIDEHATVEDVRVRRPSHGRWLQARGIGLRWIPRGERSKPVPGENRHADLIANIRYALRGGQPVAACGCSTACSLEQRHAPMAAGETPRRSGARPSMGVSRAPLTRWVGALSLGCAAQSRPMGSLQLQTGSPRVRGG